MFSVLINPFFTTDDDTEAAQLAQQLVSPQASCLLQGEDYTGCEGYLSYRTLLRKAATVQDMTPSLMLLPNDRRLHVRLSTTGTTSSTATVGFDSTAVIPLRRWTHVARHARTT